MTIEKIKQSFRNNSDCYADTWVDIGIEMKQGEVIQAMTEQRFIETLIELGFITKAENNVTMCMNGACPLRHKCKRHTMKWNDPQWVSMYYPQKTMMKNGGVVEVIYDCDHFIDNKPYIHQTK